MLANATTGGASKPPGPKASVNNGQLHLQPPPWVMHASHLDQFCAGHSTNYMKKFFFEAQVSVNLTVMLVLTTMFSTINSQLPKTSYIKMSDVWFLFNLMLPFFEVLILVWKDTLRVEKTTEINHHGKPRKVGSDSGSGSITTLQVMSEGRLSLQTKKLQHLGNF